jgi:hypothetical protein
LQQAPSPQSSPFSHDTEQDDPRQVVRPAHAVGPSQCTVVLFVASLSMPLGQVWSPVHDTEQLATASVQMICPQELTPEHRISQSFASQRMVLGHELTPAHVSSHRSPLQVMPPPQLVRPPHCTLQEVAPPQSTPLLQALGELQFTAQRMPAGHSTCPHDSSSVQSIVQTSATHVPRAAVHADVHGGALPSGGEASAAEEASTTAVSGSGTFGPESLAASGAGSVASSPPAPAALSWVSVSMRAASTAGRPG